MGYHFIHHQAKIAAIWLYECDLLNQEDILDICGFSRHTWFWILKIWNQTGDIGRKPTQRTVQACHLDKEDLDYLLELIHVNPDYFLNKLLTLLQTNRFISIHHTTIHQATKISQKHVVSCAKRQLTSRAPPFPANLCLTFGKKG